MKERWFTIRVSWDLFFFNIDDENVTKIFDFTPDQVKEFSSGDDNYNKVFDLRPVDSNGSFVSGDYSIYKIFDPEYETITYYILTEDSNILSCENGDRLIWK